MKYISFSVDDTDALFCLEFDLVIKFLNKNDIVFREEKLGPKILGIASYKQELYKVIDSKNLFNTKTTESLKYMIIQIENKKIILPVYKIFGIYKADEIHNNIKLDNFNTIVRLNGKLNMLISENLFLK